MNRRGGYSDADKDHACKLYMAYGAREAGKRTGIPENTISQWARRRGLSYTNRETARGQAEATRLRWELRRLELIHKLGEAAELALDVTIANLQGEEPNPRLAESAARVCGTMIDKAQLLSGAPTSRTALGSEPEKLRERADELDDLAKQRGKKPRAA